MSSSPLARFIVSFFVFTFGGAVGLRAQFAVSVAIDVPATIEWAAEKEYWTRELDDLATANATLRENNHQLDDANTTLREINDRIGSPTEGAKLAFGGYTKAATPSSKFISEALTREEVMSKSFATDSVEDTLTRINDLTTKAIGLSYKLGETEYKRDFARYRVSADEEKLRDTVNRAVAEFQSVQANELEFQSKQNDGMSAGTLTVSEIAGRATAIDSSQGRIDLARNRLELARAELETFLGQVKLEQRKLQAATWEELQTRKTNEHALADKMRARVGL